VKCERCGTRRALWTCIDLPEEEGARFGDEVAALCLCTRCLEASEQDGEWTAVYRIDAAPAKATS
jgi:hypothetical protein